MLDVLIVDDSAAIRKIEIRTGNVLEAGDGVEALSTLASQNVGLTLSYINMPNMDGLELLSKVKANESWKKLPMVMISTEGSQAKVLEAVEPARRATCPSVSPRTKSKKARSVLLSRSQ
jgi:two-component system chemotaxis response regulator CheY